MPQANGQSNGGLQKLVYGFDASSGCVQILLNPQYDAAPINLGFYYVLVQDDGDFWKFVYDTGILYAPGKLITLDPRTLILGKRVAIWVNWVDSATAWFVRT